MRTLVCLAVVSILVPGVLSAHPHVFIEADARLEFQGTSPEAVRLRWEFDDFFSRMVLLDFAGTGSGPLTDEQVESIRDGAFENLSNYNYFTHILIDDVELEISRVEDFHAEVEGRTLVYTFRVPLVQPNGPGAAKLAGIDRIVLGMYDDSYYSFFEYSAEPVSYHGDVPPGIETEQQERPDRRYYFNLIVPQMFHIRWN